MENNKTMGHLCRILAVILICVAVGYIILGYFVSTIDNDGEPRDGLGRLIDEVPGGFSMIMPHWAGYVWFFLDCIITFALILIIDKLFVRSKIYFTGTRRVDF